MNEGWLCPKCGSAHAPSVLTCPDLHTYLPTVFPIGPLAPRKKGTCMACRDGVCMCYTPGPGTFVVDGAVGVSGKLADMTGTAVVSPNAFTVDKTVHIFPVDPTHD